MGVPLTSLGMSEFEVGEGGREPCLKIYPNGFPESLTG
jgi:hypothetical protein